MDAAGSQKRSDSEAVFVSLQLSQKIRILQLPTTQQIPHISPKHAEPQQFNVSLTATSLFYTIYHH